MRVLLADDQPNVRSALRLLLEQELGLREVGEATNVSGLLSQVETNCPDLVLLDWELPGSKNIELLPPLRTKCPQLFVIALSGHPEARQAALSAGADAFVGKGDPPKVLLATLRDCLRRNNAEINSKEDNNEKYSNYLCSGPGTDLKLAS